MGKKLCSNPKALEARARKDEKKRSENDRIAKEKEDALWKDDDKLVNRKLNRKEEQEKKKLRELEKKQLNKQLYEEEMASLKPSKPTVTKVTRSQISNLLEKKPTTEIKSGSQTPPIEENLNRQSVEQASASTVEEAISILSVNDEAAVDRHPEKRMKAAYAAFEEVRLAQLKQESPNLRLSQLKQIIHKEWLKAPENPMNQALLAIMNAKKAK